MTRLTFLCLLALAGCGVDGAPQAPASGIDISASATMGMARNGG